MGSKFSLPRGTSDILPSEVSQWQALESKVRQILDNYHYREIRTPIFEDTELFKRSLGQSSEVVNKQLLELAGDKKEGFALRPEGTASVVRSYIENSLSRQEGISKLFYIGAMFRGERPQKGRLRQFHQIGVEVLGPDTRSAYLDAEIITLSVDILKSLGLKDFTLKINTLGSSSDKEQFAAWLRKKLKPFLGKLPADDQSRYERNVFRVLDSKERETKKIIDGLGIGYDHLSKESVDYFNAVKAALKSLDVAFEETPSLVRGLDYYTHTVFEICTAELGSQDALGAGGRYNNLVHELGGPEVDAMGFALGIERILLVLPEEEKGKGLSPLVYIAALDESAAGKAFLLLNALRQKNIPADMNYRLASVKSLMRSADKSGAKYVLIIGADEIAKNIVSIKNMESGVQSENSLSDLDGLIKDLLNT